MYSIFTALGRYTALCQMIGFWYIDEYRNQGKLFALFSFMQLILSVNVSSLFVFCHLPVRCGYLSRPRNIYDPGLYTAILLLLFNTFYCYYLLELLVIYVAALRYEVGRFLSYIVCKEGKWRELRLLLSVTRTCFLQHMAASSI